MSRSFQSLISPLGLTEGPVWTGSELLFTDIPQSAVMRYAPASSKLELFRSGTNHGNGLTLDGEGRLYACEGGAPERPTIGRRIVRYEPDGSTTVVADNFAGRRLNSPNDLAIDSSQRIWFTDPRYGPDRSDLELDHESVDRVDPDGAGGWKPAVRVTFDTTAPNGILVSPDGAILYVAESKQGDGANRELRAYPIRPDGSLDDATVLHNFAPHRGIDGMCLDSAGNIVATAGWEISGPGAMIYVFAANGRVLDTHPLPCLRPSNCTFGGPDLNDLYVTSLQGDLLRTSTDRRGIG